MPTRNEIERLAAMTHALRLDWPVSSLITHLQQNHGERPYRDLAVALAWIATDPDTKTPARLQEAGPWWTATSAQAPTKSGQRQRCPTHKVLLQAGDCPKCAEGLTRNRPANFQQIFDHARQQARAEREQARKKATQP